MEENLIKISVSQKNIDAVKAVQAYTPTQCPIAQAVSQNQKSYCAVFQYAMFFKGRAYHFSQEIVDMIEKFDKERVMEPFEFVLGVGNEMGFVEISK